jgi:hypothetical protein
MVPEHVKRSADSEANYRAPDENAKGKDIVDVSGRVPTADAVVGIGAVGEN